MKNKLDMTQEEFTLHQNMQCARMSLLSKLYELGLTKFQFKYLESEMKLSFDEVNEILEYNDKEWKEILAS